jgi:hypothetical protein
MKPSNDATPRRFLTAAEVADYLHVSLATVHRLARLVRFPLLGLAETTVLARMKSTDGSLTETSGVFEEKRRRGSQ